MTQMNPEQLREHIQQLRAVSSSPNTLRAHISATKEATKRTKSTEPKEPKESAASLASKYLNKKKP